MIGKSDKAVAGFTIIELLIALAITALLLSAAAVAFNASVTNYEENEQIFNAINKGRQALLRITAQLRTGTVLPSSPENECTLFTATGQDLTYRYDSTDGCLYLIDNSSGSSYLLCDNIAAMTFSRTTAIEDSEEYVKSVQISMTVQSGSLQRKLSAAAVIRRNLK
jgi:prepilin-type N-terminal cleavage/methylation domain-containing protein